MIEAHFQKISHIIGCEIDKATESIQIAMYFFTNKSLFEKLLHKAKQGVTISLIVHDNYINFRNSGIRFQSMADKDNCNIFISTKERPIHDKFCIIDGNTLISGSYNWTYAAENYNEENVMLVTSEKAGQTTEQTLIAQYAGEYERLIANLEPATEIPTYYPNEIDEYYTMDGKEYLMQDLLYEAAGIEDKGKAEQLAKEAISLNPENIKIQIKAADLKLIPRKRIEHSIGTQRINDVFDILIRKGAILPVEEKDRCHTAYNNQTKGSAYVYYGEEKIASKNTPIKKDERKGITKKGDNHLHTVTEGFDKRPAGGVHLLQICNIGFDGTMRLKTIAIDSPYNKNGAELEIIKDLNEIEGMITEIYDEGKDDSQGQSESTGNA